MNIELPLASLHVYLSHFIYLCYYQVVYIRNNLRTLHRNFKSAFLWLNDISYTVMQQCACKTPVSASI